MWARIWILDFYIVINAFIGFFLICEVAVNVRIIIVFIAISINSFYVLEGNASGQDDLFAVLLILLVVLLTPYAISASDQAIPSERYHDSAMIQIDEPEPEPR